jgi:hypothetical protein
MVTKIIVVIEGGVVQNILCNHENTKVEVHVIDWDNIAGDDLNESKRRTKDADEFLDKEGNADVNWIEY